jgi:thioredoxin-dependent peroxiredoxin
MEIKEGSKAPKFKLPDDKGKNLSLAKFLGAWLVLYFYPKDMTSGCTVEAEEFSRALPKFKKLKASVVGVSKDSVDRHQKFIKKSNLKISLLADESTEICKAYGVYKQKSLYGHKFMGIERTTFLINPKGRVAKIYPKVKVNGHVAKVLEDLKELVSSGGVI